MSMKLSLTPGRDSLCPAMRQSRPILDCICRDIFWASIHNTSSQCVLRPRLTLTTRITASVSCLLWYVIFVTTCSAGLNLRLCTATCVQLHPYCLTVQEKPSTVRSRITRSAMLVTMPPISNKRSSCNGVLSPFTRPPDDTVSWVSVRLSRSADMLSVIRSSGHVAASFKKHTWCLDADGTDPQRLRPLWFHIIRLRSAKLASGRTIFPRDLQVKHSNDLLEVACARCLYQNQPRISSILLVLTLLLRTCSSVMCSITSSATRRWQTNSTQFLRM